MREPPLEPAAIEAAALEAEWALPRSLAVLAVGAGAEREPGPLHLPPGSIVETIGEIAVAVIPDPDAPGRVAEIERATIEAGASAGLGSTVDWPDAAISFARARAALELDNGRPSLILARERVGELMLRSDVRLERLSPGSRNRMTETLRSWLAVQGRIGPMAERLGVHPQTARYRLARLRELFGPALDDPDERFWLDLALRSQR